MTKKKPARPVTRRRASKSAPQGSLHVRLPFTELPYGTTVATIGSKAPHPVGLADELQRGLLKVGDQAHALIEIFSKVFGSTQALLAIPGAETGKVFVWPLLHPALLPNTDFRQQLAMTLYTLYQTCVRIGGERLQNPDGTVATASIFPHAAGDLPSWKKLLTLLGVDVRPGQREAERRYDTSVASAASRPVLARRRLWADKSNDTETCRRLALADQTSRRVDGPIVPARSRLRWSPWNGRGVFR